jgi:hypothetical protein
VGQAVVFADVAGRATNDEVLGAVASTTAQRHNVIDVILPTDALAAPVAPATLALVLGVHIGLRE